MNASPELYYTIFLAAILLLSLFFLARTLQLLKKKKIWAGCRNSGYFLLLLLFLISVSLVASNVLTYHRLTHESPIALLHVEHLNNQHYRVQLLHLDNCHKSSYVLQGDEWQIDARIIKWHGWANIIGLDAGFQLDRISGRYQNIEQQATNLPTVYALQSAHKYDLWALKKKYQWLPGFDAEYGQSVFLPMQNNQFYQLYMTQTGIIARKKNTEAQERGNCIL